MRILLAAALAVPALAAPVAADEFTDVLSSALEAYEEGEIGIAREELDYAMDLLNELKSESLAGFLPEPLEGWTRTESDGEGMAVGMFGGGTAAAANYSSASDEFTITVIANSPMVSSIGAMITGMSGMAGGKTIRIQRTQFMNNDSELQGVVDGRIMISVSGDASVDDKKAHLEQMDFRKLARF